MKKTYCDICGDEVNDSSRLRGQTKKANNILNFEIITGDAEGWNHGDFCKYCILDAVRSIDDRPIIEKQNEKQKEKLIVGKKVTVYDRYRFATPLKGIITKFSTSDDGVEVRLLESNNNHFPIESYIWVSEKQVRIIKEKQA